MALVKTSTLATKSRARAVPRSTADVQAPPKQAREKPRNQVRKGDRNRQTAAERLGAATQEARQRCHGSSKCRRRVAAGDGADRNGSGGGSRGGARIICGDHEFGGFIRTDARARGSQPESGERAAEPIGRGGGVYRHLGRGDRDQCGTAAQIGVDHHGIRPTCEGGRGDHRGRGRYLRPDQPARDQRGDRGSAGRRSWERVCGRGRRSARASGNVRGPITRSAGTGGAHRRGSARSHRADREGGESLGGGGSGRAGCGG